jgi:formylmethanofuran dehydrogenase subunit C
MKLTLEAAWKIRRSLRADGDKLQDEGGKLWVEGDKLQAEGDKLWAEGRKLRAEGEIGWFTAIIAEFGNIVVSWDGSSCILPNGERYDE